MTYGQSTGRRGGRGNQSGRDRNQNRNQWNSGNQWNTGNQWNNADQWNDETNEQDRDYQFRRQNRNSYGESLEDVQGSGTRNFPFDNRDQNVEQYSQPRSRNYYDQSGFGQEGGGQGGYSGQRQSYGEYGSQYQNQSDGNSGWNSGSNWNPQRTVAPTRGYSDRGYQGSYGSQGGNYGSQGSGYGSQQYGSQGYGSQSVSQSGYQQGGYSGSGYSQDDYRNQSSTGWQQPNSRTNQRGGMQYGSMGNTWNTSPYATRENASTTDSDSYGWQGQSERRQGPKGYTRSDERIKEDVNDRLSQSHWIDVSDVEVDVKSGEVTLSGTVPGRAEKFEIERIVDAIYGVSDIENKLKIKRQGSMSEQSSSGAGNSGTTNSKNGSGTSGSASATSSTGSSGSTSGKYSNK